MSDPMDISQTLLTRAHSPTLAQTIFSEKVIQRPLQLRPSSPEPSARATRRKARNEFQAAAKKRKPLKPRPLSAAEKRKLCLNEIPKEQRKFALYEPLHHLWLDYVREILNFKDADVYLAPNFAGPLIASADMHGAKIKVVRSRCVSRTGVEGIVVRDGKMVFEVVTRENELKTIPKEHTIFRFEIPFPKTDGDSAAAAASRKPLIFEIHGDEFKSRAPDRANKKFKMHYQPYL